MNTAEPSKLVDTDHSSRAIRIETRDSLGLVDNGPEFSIIIPFRDRQAELKACLQSLTAQTVPPDYEIILVDDGSKERFTDADFYSKGVVRPLLIRQPPLGIASARNRGVWASRGRWVVFVDSDCALESDALNRLARVVASAKETAAFQLELHGDSSTLVRSMEDTRLFAIQAEMCASDGSVEYLNTSGMAIRGDYARSHLPLFDANFERSEDTGLLARLCSEGRPPVFAEGVKVYHRPAASLRAYLLKHYQIGECSVPARRMFAKPAGSAVRVAGRKNMLRLMRLRARSQGHPRLTVPLILLGYGIERAGRAMGRMFALTPGRFEIMGCPVDSIREAEVVGRIVASLHGRRNSLVTYLHAWSLVRSRQDPEFAKSFADFDVVQPDGMGVVVALFLCRGVRSRKVTANEYFHDVCSICEADGYSMALVGGLPEVVQEAAAALRREFPALRIGHVAPGYLSEVERSELFTELKNDPPQLIVLGMGQPAQEQLAAEWRTKLPATTIVCVGGLFDYLAGRNVTPPRWVRFGGLEWLVRLVTHPRRDFRRYVIGLPTLAYYMAEDVVVSVYRRVRFGRSTPAA